MSEVTGIFASISTASGTHTGSDDHLYLGVCGTVGGREFALDVTDFDDWEPDSVVTYAFGPRARAFAGAREPANAADQLDRMTICKPNVTHVYLRKQGDRTPKGDDFWELSECIVYIMSDHDTRIFVSTGSARLGNEYGHKVWLAESAGGDGYEDTRLYEASEKADCEEN